MAVSTNYFTLLFFGLALWVSKYSAPVLATGLGAAFGDHPDLAAYAAIRNKGEYERLAARIGYNPWEAEENVGRDKMTASLNIGLTGDRIDIGNMNGITIRARNPGKQLDVTINNNKVFLGGQVVCSIRRKNTVATHQKSRDGTYWYTNLKVGEPMTEAEIDAFEDEWAKHEEEVEKRRAEARKQL